MATKMNKMRIVPVLLVFIVWPGKETKVKSANKWFSNCNDCYEGDKQGVVIKGFLEEVMLKTNRSQAGQKRWGVCYLTPSPASPPVPLWECLWGPTL